MNFPRLRLAPGLSAIFILATAVAAIAQYTPPGPATQGPGPAAADNGVPTPGPSGSGGPTRGKHKPGAQSSSEPTETPEPPQFTNLTGVWEIELQKPGNALATYEHLSIVQAGNTLTGYWEHPPNNTRTPLTGSYDGRLIGLTVPLPNGDTATFAGYVENFSDMVGMLRMNDKDQGTPFTGQHRKKERV